MLARREHTRQELAQKLAPWSENPDEIGPLIEDFERRGWLSERRAVDEMVASRRRRFGARRIAQELRAKGVDESAIAGVERDLAAGEFEAARAVWRKKFGKRAASAAERGKQVRFLQGRGFALETAVQVIERADDDDQA